MAATCSHILTNVSAHSETGAPSHSQEVSPISSATLHTYTTLHSQPTEPLRPTTPQTGQNNYAPSQQPRKFERSPGLPRWSQSHVKSSHHAIVNEKGFRNPLRRVKLLRRIKNALAVVMALWAVYNTIRYFLAFCIYGSITGQALSLTLGSITGLSFAFTCCATILSFVQPRLLIHGFPVQSLSTMRSLLQYSASGCLLGPSIVNFILIFVWKKTTDPELQTRHRCRLDIDLVWSAPFSLCNHKTRTWGLWLVLSAIRLVVTLVITITFHFIASSTQLKLVRRTRSRHHQQPKGHGHNRLDSYLTPLIRRDHHSQSSVVLVPDYNPPRPSSDSIHSTKASPRNRLRPNRSRLSAISDDNTQTEPLNNADFLPMSSEPAGESNSFVHRFRTLISQITRETEEGIAFAHSDDSSSSHRALDSPPNRSPDLVTEAAYQDDHQDGYDNEDGFYTSSATQVHEQRQQYPVGEEIRMLNGFFRRLPTIKSMGSHELQSSIEASSANRDLERIGTQPTRNTIASGAGTDFSSISERHSGTGSLTAQAEVLAAKYLSTEIGERISRGDIRKVDSPSTIVDNLKSLGASTNTGSVLSYLTLPESISKPLVISDEHLNPKENSRLDS